MLKLNTSLEEDLPKINYVKLVLGILFFRLLLDFIYSEFVSTVYGYAGFENGVNNGAYIFSIIILMAFLPLIIQMHHMVTLSRIILLFFAYCTFIPFTTMIAFYPFAISYIIENIIYWLLLFGTFILMPHIKVARIKNDSLVNIILCMIILMFFGVVVLISWRYTGFRISLDILNVYALRSEASAFDMPTILTYIYSASKIANIVLTVFFLSRSKYAPAAFVFLIQILSFSIDGSKTVLLGTVLAVLLYWLYDHKYIARLPWLFSLLGIAGLMEWYLNKTYLVLSLTIRRVMFVPNLLNYNYYDFFSSNSPDYFQQSFLRYFGFDSAYSGIGHLIAVVYYNSPEASANNGLLSDAYANMGFVGIFIMPFVLVLMLKILDACAEGLDIRVVVVSGIMIAFTFVSSFFFTIMLTHGLMALCVILYLLPRQKQNIYAYKSGSEDIENLIPVQSTVMNLARKL